MRYAELFGAPGVGKSTLLKAISGHVLPHSKMRAAKARTDTAWIDECGGTLDWCEAARSSLERAEGIHVIPGNGWAVDDHGPLQRAEWLDLIGGDVTGYLAQVPLPDLAVWCRAPVEVIQQRIKLRVHKEDRSADTIRACLAAIRIDEAVSSRGPMPVALNMQRSIDFTAGRLRQALC